MDDRLHAMQAAELTVWFWAENYTDGDPRQQRAWAALAAPRNLGSVSARGTGRPQWLLQPSVIKLRARHGRGPGSARHVVGALVEIPDRAPAGCGMARTKDDSSHREGKDASCHDGCDLAHLWPGLLPCGTRGTASSISIRSACRLRSEIDHGYGAACAAGPQDTSSKPPPIPSWAWSCRAKIPFEWLVTATLNGPRTRSPGASGCGA